VLSFLRNLKSEHSANIRRRRRSACDSRYRVYGIQGSEYGARYTVNLPYLGTLRLNRVIHWL
jgi:hypothetical protein